MKVVVKFRRQTTGTAKIQLWEIHEHIQPYLLYINTTANTKTSKKKFLYLKKDNISHKRHTSVCKRELCHCMVFGEKLTGMKKI